MQCIVLQESFVKALKTVIKAIPSTPQLPVLQCFLLTVTEDKHVTIAGTDLYLGVRVTIACTDSIAGSVAVPAKVFFDAINTLSPEKITLKIESSSLIISTPKSTSKVTVQPSDEYPQFPEKSGQQLSLPIEIVDQIATYTGFSFALDQARLVLTTLSFKQKKDFLEVVSTDGFRLGVLQIQGTFLPEQTQFLIPAKAFLETNKVAQQYAVKNITLSRSEELKQVFMTIDDVEVYMRLIEGEYPPYEKIMPSSFATEVTLDAETFITYLKQAQVFSREASHIVHFTFDTEVSVIKSQSSAQGEYEAKLPAECSGKLPASIAFNSKYVQDFLTTVKPEKIWLGLNDALKPAAFREVGNDRFTYVVMPFRLNE